MIYQVETDGMLYTYSDTNYIIQNETGLEYEDAYDIIPCPYTYAESDREKPRKEDDDVSIQ